MVSNKKINDEAKFLAKICLAAILILIQFSCSSSSDSDDDDDTSVLGSSSGSSSSDFVPTIDLDVPSSALSLALLGDASDSILERKADRVERIVTRMNQLIERINSDSVESTGSFDGKGPDGLLSGKVEDLTDDETYAYEAVLCYDDAVFMHLKWDADGYNVASTRDFSKSPMGNSESEFFVEVEFTRDDDGNSSLAMNAYGTPWKMPPFDVDGDLLAEYAYSTVDADGVFELQSVNDFFETAPDDDDFTGDDYLVGQINDDATGSFVGYAKGSDDCTDDFDEDNEDDHGFCVGRSIDADGDDEYTDDERTTAWESLDDIGVANSSNLKSIAMDDDLSCD